MLFAEGDYLAPDVIFVGSRKARLISDRGVDGEAGTVEVWRFTDGPDEPDTHDSDDVLRWAPDDGAATLEIDVGELFRA